MCVCVWGGGAGFRPFIGPRNLLAAIFASCTSSVDFKGSSKDAALRLQIFKLASSAGLVSSLVTREMRARLPPAWSRFPPSRFD